MGRESESVRRETLHLKLCVNAVRTVFGKGVVTCEVFDLCRN